ncbi:MAG: sodium-dependent transporter [Oscillospiraceae bacterium]|nr:sodium-dependent transporter [Oscillospiraceae bacterium]
MSKFITEGMISMSNDATRGTWTSRSTFILAAVGSAVGLGNAWRFPGLAAKHGGGAFLMVYLIAMVVIGIPLLAMEISIGRRMKRGAPGSLRGLNKKFEPIGWAATANAFIIEIYYSVVFAWVIMMAIFSFKFAGLTGDSEAASGVWTTLIKTTGTTSGYATISVPVLLCLIGAWAMIWLCIRNSAHSVGKVVKYTVFLPVICLVLMAAKGLTMEGAAEGMKALFIPDFSALSNASLWIDAIGQVFYSMSIMMAIMYAYGSFLQEDSNVAADTVIIAFSDLAISVLSGIVLFSTMYGTGMTTNDMSTSGIGTAFMIYPSAIVNLTGNGTANAVFAFIFYFCLCTLAIDSAFSIVEGVATAIADKFNIAKRKSTLYVCIVSAVISLFFVTGAGLAWLDIVDNWCNSFNLILVGVLEAIAVGWFFKTDSVLKEINRNTNKFRMPAWWFNTAIRYIAPLLLAGFFTWNFVALIKSGGIYGAESGYSLASNIIGGWLITVLVFASGYIINAIVKKNKKLIKTAEDVWTD